MAASSSICCNFLSFLTPSKPPSHSKPAPLHLSPQTHKPKDAFAPLLAHPAGHSSSSSALESVINPSLAYANTLFFKSAAYNVQVIVDEGESEERLLNRFRREVMRAGVIQEVRRRRYFENTQDEKKRRTRDAAKRNKRRRTFSRSPLMQSRPGQDGPAVPKKSDDDEDNWDMPQGDIPY